MKKNVLHKTSKGLREMNYQDTQQFERATMLNNNLNLYWFYAVLWAAVLF